jgi:hypothetical protein
VNNFTAIAKIYRVCGLEGSKPGKNKNPAFAGKEQLWHGYFTAQGGE